MTYYKVNAPACNSIFSKVEGECSNASTARMLSFLSFLFGHLLLAGGMWIWTNKLAEEAKIHRHARFPVHREECEASGTFECRLQPGLDGRDDRGRAADHRCRGWRTLSRCGHSGGGP